MIKVTNLQAVFVALDRWLVGAEIACTEALRGLAVEVFSNLLLETPQWSGNAVANWNFSVGWPDYSANTDFKVAYVADTVSSLMHIPLYDKGSLPAIQAAVAINLGREFEVTKITDKIFLSNAATELDGKMYIQLLEENPNNFLREENDPGHMVAYTTKDFNNLGQLRSDEVERYKSLRIGGSV